MSTFICRYLMARVFEISFSVGEVLSNKLVLKTENQLLIKFLMSYLLYFAGPSSAVGEHSRFVIY